MAFSMDLDSADIEFKKKISRELIVKPKKTQYNQNPKPHQVFDKEDEIIYLPLRKYSEYLPDKKFPFKPEEYPRTSINFIYDLYTKETDPKGRGRDQNILVEEVIKQLDNNHTAFISAFTGYGKCLSPGTKILMFNGTKKKVEDIVIGDKIMGDDSKERNILSTCHGEDGMFEIIPEKGESFIVNYAHILTLCVPSQGKIKRNKNRYNVKFFDGCKISTESFSTLGEAEKFSEEIKNELGNIFDVSMKEYLKLSRESKDVLKCFWKEVHYPFREVPIDPYYLGIWLGKKGSFSNNEKHGFRSEDLIEHLENFAPKHHLQIKKKIFKNETGYFFSEKDKESSGYKEELKKLNLLEEVHIPLIYKVNSRKVRLELLAGLFDFHGWGLMGKNFISQSSQKLSEDIQDLCRSLGFFCETKKGFDIFHSGEKIETYENCFSGESANSIPTFFFRCTNPRIGKQNLCTSFRVESKGKGEYHGFQIDGNGRFLLGSYMVTHNTSVSTYLLCYFKYKTMILCHNDTLKEQWKEEILKFTGNKVKVQIVKGKKPLDDKADVYIIGIQKASSLSRDDVIDIGMVIIDESHICTTTAFTKSLLKFQPMYLLGLSATPERVDGLDSLLEINFGKKENFIKREEVKDFTVVKYKTKYQPEISYQVVNGEATLAWTNMLSSLAEIKERWIEIAEIAISEPNHKIILLCDRQEMAKNIYDYLEEAKESVELLIGTKKKWDKSKRILVAGVKKGGVGLNDPDLTMLILAADMKDVKQCEGRIRTTGNMVYDVVDNYRTLENHWNLREKWYKKRGAKIVLGGILKTQNIKGAKGKNKNSFTSESEGKEPKQKRFLKPSS